MDFISVFFGIVLTIFAMYVVYIWMIKSNYNEVTIDDPTDDEEFQKLQDTPHCPFCRSYDLTLVDDNKNVPWLKGRISELDHYRCNRCYETFSDEDWKTVRVYE